MTMVYPVFTVTTFLQRIEMGCTHAGIPPGRGRQAELARRLSKYLNRTITRSTVGVWFKSTKKDTAVEPKMLIALSDVLNVNMRWLVLGPPETMAKMRHFSIRENELIQIGNELRQLRPDLYETWVSDARVKLELLRGPVNHQQRHKSVKP